MAIHKTKMLMIKKREKYEDELKASNMMKKEYFIASKRFDEPKTGTGTNTDGSFEWTLYGLSLHEIKRFDEDSEGIVVDKYDGLDVSLFKSAKSFVEKVADIPVDVKFKVTQTPVEGKAYKEFQVELLDGEEIIVKKVAPVEMSLADKIKELKATGLDANSVFVIVESKYDTTEAVVNALYGAL